MEALLDRYERLLQEQWQNYARAGAGGDSDPINANGAEQQRVMAEYSRLADRFPDVARRINQARAPPPSTPSSSSASSSRGQAAGPSSPGRPPSDFLYRSFMTGTPEALGPFYKKLAEQITGNAPQSQVEHTIREIDEQRKLLEGAPGPSGGQQRSRSRAKCRCRC